MPAYTWATGETITATKLNALETEAYRVANQIAYGSSTSASSTTSTSYVDGGASVTFTAAASSVYIEVTGGGAQQNSSSRYGEIGININSTDYTVCHLTGGTDTGYDVPFAGGVLVTGLTPNTSYTAKIRLRVVVAGTLSVNRNARSRQAIAVWDIAK